MSPRSLVSAIPLPACDEDTCRRRWWVSLAAVFGVWTLIGLFYGSRSYLNGFLFGQARLPDVRPLLGNMADAYMWAFFTLYIFRVARGFPVNAKSWPRTVPVHAVAAVAISLLNIIGNVAVNMLIWPDEPPEFAAYFRLPFYTNIQWYAMIAGAWHALDWYRRLRDREVQSAKLETRLTQAQLEALKAQIQPHFLFNTLHSISELVHEDPGAADRMITRLGDLLRVTVDNAGTHEVTLAQEMEFLGAYLDIQRTRFQDSLMVDVDVPPHLSGALVPNLVLQPLVENAIRHGTAPRGGVGRIRVTAARDGAILRLEVRDNGGGLPSSNGPRTREGVGVRNTRTRLEQMYGASHLFELKNGERGGVVATVRLPYHEIPIETVPAAAEVDA